VLKIFNVKNRKKNCLVLKFFKKFVLNNIRVKQFKKIVLKELVLKIQKICFKKFCVKIQKICLKKFSVKNISVKK